MLAKVLDTCLKEWGITAELVLMIVSDNGANMVKACMWNIALNFETRF